MKQFFATKSGLCLPTRANGEFFVESTMIRRLAACGLLAISVFANADRAASGDEAAVEKIATEVQDILFCAPRRPFLIRLHLSVNGKGFRNLRQSWADAQFVTLDADSNGFLEGEELQQLPTPEMLRTSLTVESANRLSADSDPFDGKVSLVECRRYLLAAAGTPFSLPTQANGGRALSSNNNSGAQVNLFPKLDTNRDGKLSREEIAAAEARIRRYDRNEDDVVDALELQQGLPEELAVAQQRLSGVMGMLMVVDTADQGLSNSRRLLEGYDKVSRDPATKAFRKDERLSPSELSIEAEAFGRADRNRDGKLDRTELAELASAMTPTMELAIEAPSAAGEFSVKALRPGDQSHAALIELKREGDGRPVLVLEETALSLTAAGPDAGMEQQLRETYLRQFKNLDQDKNDYIDRPEMQRFGFQDAFFTQADIDRDEKLFEKEYTAHIDREIELSKTSFILEVAGDGRSLFRLIDTLPADGRLSLRELVGASSKLLKWDANRDGTLTQSELSISLSAVFRTGTPRINGPFAVASTIQGVPSSAPSQSDAERDVPTWFSKMDRNGDGDLSPKEFLGRRELFNQIDRNHDGLVSSDEAVTAHRDAVAKSPP